MIKEQKSKKVKKHKKDKKRKKSKKKRKHSASSDSDCTDLDALLLAKYSKLKDKLHKEGMAKLDVDSPDTSDSDSNTRKSTKEKHSVRHKRKHHSSKSSSDDDDNDDNDDDDRKSKKPYGLQMFTNSKRHALPQPRTSISNKTEKDLRPSVSANHKPETSNRWKKPERKRLTEEEIEQKRLEMMDNVRWRNEEREKNVSRYRKEEREEKKQSKEYNTEFLTKQLSYAASHGTVESRIKANINNIQRSGMAMDKNFARR